jgi:hypothetical protein
LDETWIDSDQDLLYVQQATGGLGTKDMFWDAGSVLSQVIFQFKSTLSGQIQMLSSNTAHRNGNGQYLSKSFAPVILHTFDILIYKPDISLINISELSMKSIDSTRSDFSTLFSSYFGNQYTYILDCSSSFVDRNHSYVTNRSITFEVVKTFILQNGMTSFPNSLNDALPLKSPVTTTVRHTILLLSQYSKCRTNNNCYIPRLYHPRSGINRIKYYNESSDLFSAREKSYIVRYDLSMSITPKLVYYIDSDTPMEYHQCFKEGIEWWDQAFQYVSLLYNLSYAIYCQLTNRIFAIISHVN